jgi:hypothetical protein
MIALIERKLLWFMELEQRYPGEDRPWRPRLPGSGLEPDRVDRLPSQPQLGGTAVEAPEPTKRIR